MGCANSKAKEERRAKRHHTHDLTTAAVMPIHNSNSNNSNHNNNNNNNNNQLQYSTKQPKDPLYNAENQQIVYSTMDNNRKPRSPTASLTQDYQVAPSYSHQNQTYLHSLSNAPPTTPPHTKSREELTSNDHHQSSLLNITLNSSQQTSHGSIIRNGVYYSESELSEENSVWTPKYWTPERISKWVEEIETTPNSSSESSGGGRSPPHLQTVSTLS